MFSFFCEDKETEALTLHHSALGYSYPKWMDAMGKPPYDTLCPAAPTPLKPSPSLHLLQPAEGCCLLFGQWLLEQRSQQPLF